MKKIILLSALLLTAVAFTACATVKEIPEDRTSAQIIQMGQNAVSSADYNSAILCYQTAIDRFGTNPTVYAEATYEMGHVYLKQKKYDKAYQIFSDLLNLYDYNAAVLPPAYKKLATISINQIPEKKLAELQSDSNN